MPQAGKLELLKAPRVPILGWSSYFADGGSIVPSIWDAPNIQPTSSGRAAIALALEAFGIRPGDRVLVPTYHCATMVAPIAALGAEPIFFPVVPSGVPAIDSLERFMDCRTRAIIVPHYFGLPTPMAELRRFCDDHGLCLIEDCAHAFFGLSDQYPIGSWGDYTIASLPKFFPVAEGGCLASWRHELGPRPLSSRRFTDEARALANALELGARYGRFPGANLLINTLFALKARATRTTPDPAIAAPPAALDVEALLREFQRDAIAFARPTTISWLLARHYGRPRLITKRRRNYQLLSELLCDCPNARLLRPDLPEQAVPYVLPLQVSNPDGYYQRIRAAGVSLYRWDLVRWPGVPDFPHDVGAVWSHQIFQLSVHQDLSSCDIENIARAVRAILSSPPS
ncbi:MAG TPA: DegT/DnrJ/EryC1/StrS family aminotransferase [Rhodocyclaceae bacterium]|nr:DegT/DnrJ/EryC1/StrS family aminotransferase [Rhodocyclaceae bacterium]HUY02660.1 DegT/DnrJ/EryC1/StrS family aminotransferase [Rhodocyclaceae bacterium]